MCIYSEIHADASTTLALSWKIIFKLEQHPQGSL